MSHAPTTTPLATIYRGGLVASSIAIIGAAIFIVFIAYAIFFLTGARDDWSVALPVFLVFALLPGIFILVGIMGIRQRVRIFEDGIEGRGVFAAARFVPFAEVVDVEWHTYHARRRATHMFVLARVRGKNGATAFMVPQDANPQMLKWAHDRLTEATGGRSRLRDTQ